MANYDPHSYAQTHPLDRWIFRWAFELYGEDRRTGGWFPPERFEETCRAVEGPIEKAYLEGKHFGTKEIRTFAECAGEDYEVFQRLEVLISNAEFSRTHVYGMRLVMKEAAIVALENGELRYERKE